MTLGAPDAIHGLARRSGGGRCHVGAASMTERIRGYRAFWPYYVSEHSRAWTRRMHFVGTTGAVALVVAAGVLGEPLLLVAAVVCGYFFAWLSHLLIERKPAGDLHSTRCSAWPATFTCGR